MNSNDTQRIIEVDILSVAPKLTMQNRPYLDVELQRQGMRFPDRLKAWNPEPLRGLVPGMHVDVVVVQDRVKQGKTDDGQWGSYWWSIVRLADDTADNAVITFPPQAPASVPTSPVQTPSRGDAVRDAAQLSIQRSVALKEAREWVQGRGEGGSIQHVLEAASIFASFLATGEVPVVDEDVQEDNDGTSDSTTS